MYTHLYLRALLLAVMGTTSEFYNGVSSEYISISNFATFSLFGTIPECDRQTVRQNCYNHADAR